MLVACEFSGVVRDAFRRRGHDAWSCDLLPSERPGQHIQGDVLPHLGDGWDLMIAHPPCTHLAASGAKHFGAKRADGRMGRAYEFFMELWNAPVPRVCIENPVGVMSSLWRPPDQVVQPWYFGDEAQKTTCLWLRGLPPLFHAADDELFSRRTHVGRGEFVVTSGGRRLPKWYSNAHGRNGTTRATERGRTFPGLAREMARQWLPVATRAEVETLK